MRYCKNCLMPDTRPNIKFQDDECIACINYRKQESTDWIKRKDEFEKLCQKYRNGNEMNMIVQLQFRVEKILIFKFIT